MFNKIITAPISCMAVTGFLGLSVGVCTWRYNNPVIKYKPFIKNEDPTSPIIFLKKDTNSNKCSLRVCREYASKRKG